MASYGTPPLWLSFVRTFPRVRSAEDVGDDMRSARAFGSVVHFFHANVEYQFNRFWVPVTVDFFLLRRSIE